MGVLDEFFNSCNEVHAAALGVYRVLRFFTNPDLLDDTTLRIILDDLWYYGFGLVAAITLPALLLGAAVWSLYGFSAGVFILVAVWGGIYIWSRGHDPFFPTRKVLA